MKNHSLGIILLICLALVGCSPSTKEKGKEGIIYTCAMHPQIRRDKPGNCPICGMRLTPISKESAVTAPSTEMPTMGAPDPEHHDAGTLEAPAGRQIMASQNKMGNIQAEPADVQVLTHTIQVYGDIKYIFDSHLDLTSFYPGRVERVLIPYNTTEVEKGTPLLELYSEEAIADQDKYLQGLRDLYLTTFQERKIVQAQIETVRARLFRIAIRHDESVVRVVQTESSCR